MDDSELVRRAIAARGKSYCPYSGFAVGAALLGKSGKSYEGCNIENAAYSVTNCAERSALFTAISQGEREFEAIAIAGAVAGQKNSFPICTPCGVCRQALYEFSRDMRVLLVESEETWEETTLSQLLPWGFGPQNLAEPTV